MTETHFITHITSCQCFWFSPSSTAHPVSHISKSNIINVTSAGFHNCMRSVDCRVEGCDGLVCTRTLAWWSFCHFVQRLCNRFTFLLLTLKPLWYFQTVPQQLIQQQTEKQFLMGNQLTQETCFHVHQWADRIYSVCMWWSVWSVWFPLPSKTAAAGPAAPNSKMIDANTDRRYREMQLKSLSWSHKKQL